MLNIKGIIEIIMVHYKMKYNLAFKKETFSNYQGIEKWHQEMAPSQKLIQPP